MSMQKNILKAFRIGDQGSYTSSGFIFKARADANEILIDRTWKYDKSIHDINQYAQILMLRFCDSYLSNLPTSSDILPLNKGLEIILNIDISNQNSELAWDPMMASTRVLKYLYLQEHILNDSNCGDVDTFLDIKNKINSRINFHVEKFKSIKIPNNNHGLQGLHALVALSMYNYSHQSIDSAIYNLANVFKNKFNCEGFYEENSSEYHFYGVQLIDSFNSLGWYNNTALNELHDLAISNYNDLFATKGEVFSFGDTDRHLIKRQVQKNVIPYIEEEPNRMEIKNITGYALSKLNDNVENSSLMLVNHFHCNTHNHHDYMSFEWFCANSWIIIDPGKYSYDDTSISKWFYSDTAHNTIQLSRLGHNPQQSKKNINGYDFLNHRVLVAKIADKNFNASRTIIHMPYRVCIIDDIENNLDITQSTASCLLIGYDFKEIKVISEFELEFSSEHLRLTVCSNTPLKSYYGSHEPFRGWYSPRYRNLEPCWQIESEFNIHSKDTKSVTFNISVDCL